MPARYDRPEAESPVMMSLESYTYEIESQATDDWPAKEENQSADLITAADQGMPGEGGEDAQNKQNED